MNKQEFLAQLREGLNGLPQEDIDERIAFYGEMIDDRLEDGLTEEEAVEAIGTTDEVVAQIIADTPLTKLVKERVKPKRKLKVWEIVLIAAGSPVWVPLLIGTAAVAFALYVILWAIVVLLWAVDLALAVCLPGCAFSAALFFGQGYGASGFATLGAGVLCGGLAVFLFFGCLAAVKGTALLAKKAVLGIKSLFIRKEAAK